MTRPADFTRVIRDGRRAGQPRIVAHFLPQSGSTESARVGLVVSKAVGNAVVRHRVSRQLRHQMGSRLDRLALGSMLVLRARPAAAGATSAVLGDELDRLFERLGEASR